MVRKRNSSQNGKSSKGGAKGKQRATAKAKNASTRRLRPFLFGCLKWGATLGVWGVIAVLGIVAWYATDLPDLDDALAQTRKPTITVLDRRGQVLHRAGDLVGLPVALKELPDALSQAVLATEDRRFYDHFGIDFIGLGRATVRNLSEGRIVQGGSTITQQLAKNLFLTPARTLKRKVQEVLLALWLEHRFSKDQILTLYLNRVYLGAGTYGVDAAARRYYGTPASGLSAYQSAVIAGLLKAPSRFNPKASPRRAHARAQTVLANMVAAGFLTEAQAAAAGTRKDVVVAKASRTLSGRYFVDWVLDRVPGFVPRHDRDLIIQTTLDAALQRRAEADIEATLKASGAPLGISEGALVTLAPDGAIRALVGGRSYARSQFNRVTQALRQPGSAFKPIVYLAALENGFTPDSRVDDAPISIAGWEPGNFSGRFEGPVSLERALSKSINTVAVRLAQQVGPKRVAATARRLGITQPLPEDASLALGTGEVSLLDLTAAYGPFANGGAAAWPHGVREIRDTAGTVLYRRHGSDLGNVVDPRPLADLNRMMASVVETGTAKAARLGRPAGGKTGTSQNFRDAWFVGYTADLITGVWFGNDNGRSMKGVTGGGLPAQTWQRFMAAAHEGLAVRPLPGLDRAPPVAAVSEAQPQTPVKRPEKRPEEKDEEDGFFDRIWGLLHDGGG